MAHTPDSRWRFNAGTDDELFVACTVRCLVCGREIDIDEDCWTRIIGSGETWAVQYLCLADEEELE